MKIDKYLNDEKYKKRKKKLIVVAFLFLIVGGLIGGSLIATGLKKRDEVILKYSEENKVEINEYRMNSDLARCIPFYILGVATIAAGFIGFLVVFSRSRFRENAVEVSKVLGMFAKSIKDGFEDDEKEDD